MAKLCEWCAVNIPTPVPTQRFCGVVCRKRSHRFGVSAAGGTSDAIEPRAFCYADPPYPGKAMRYYGMPEVDHAALVAWMSREFSAWALSTSAEALPAVLRLVPLELEPRVGIWDRLCARGGRSFRARGRWEPVIYVGARPQVVEADDRLEDLLAYGGRQRTHPNALVGMKPGPFWEWLFRLLGARPCDELVEPFPGSGAGARAWQRFAGVLELHGTPAGRDVHSSISIASNP